MPHKAEEGLSSAEAEIAFVIWKRREGYERDVVPGAGMTLREIAKATPGGTATAVKRHVRRLVERKHALLVTTTVLPFQRKEVGQAPVAYTVPSYMTITWPTTAQILQAIYQEPDGIGRPQLIGLVV